MLIPGAYELPDLHTHTLTGGDGGNYSDSNGVHGDPESPLPLAQPLLGSVLPLLLHTALQERQGRRGRIHDPSQSLATYSGTFDSGHSEIGTTSLQWTRGLSPLCPLFRGSTV